LTRTPRIYEDEIGSYHWGRSGSGLTPVTFVLTATNLSQAVRKAIEDHKKRTIEGKQGEIEKLDARIQELHKQAQVLRENALQRAGLSGRNPYPGRAEAKLRQAQLKLVYHRTADWESRTPEEVDGNAPPKLKKWLKEVRGY